jgi:hypothetical protein
MICTPCRVIELVRMCGTHGREINVYKVLVGNLKGRDHFEDLRVGWGIILKRTLKK